MARTPEQKAAQKAANVAARQAANAAARAAEKAAADAVKAQAKADKKTATQADKDAAQAAAQAARQADRDAARTARQADRPVQLNPRADRPKTSAFNADAPAHEKGARTTATLGDDGYHRFTRLDPDAGVSEWIILPPDNEMAP